MRRDIADLRREIDDLKDEMGEDEYDAGGESEELSEREHSAIDSILASAHERRPDDLERAETAQEILDVITGGPPP